MLDFFRKLFDSDFMPHGHCYYWQPGIVWLHVASDGLTAISYYIIPLSLIYLVRRRRDLVFNWMFILFGIFILACGTTHLMSIWTLWHGTYRLDGLIKAVTAAASFPTAMLMFRLVPRAIALPSANQLRTEVEERRRAEDEIRRLNSELERRVERRTKSLARSNEALKKFAYVASHDLQEPIRMIASYNQLLDRRYRGKLGPDADEYIKFAVEGSLRMSRLVADLLEYSRSLDDDASHTGGWVDANAALHAAKEDLQLAIRETGADIRASGLPDVFISETQLKQVFQNLISNAIKYAKPGVPPVIDIQAIRRDHNWLFSVRDNGVGFDQKYGEQIFEAFKRLHGRETPGSGVGLTICRNIVQSYGGCMWAESAPDQGSTFYFTLPVQPSAAPRDESAKV